MSMKYEGVVKISVSIFPHRWYDDPGVFFMGRRGLHFLREREFFWHKQFRMSLSIDFFDSR